MNLIDILHLDEFALPAVNNTGQPFVVFIEQALTNYLTLLEDNKATLFNSYNDIIFGVDDYIDRIRKYKEALIFTLQEFHHGRPDIASTFFLDFMDQINSILTAINSATITIDPDTLFFRCRNYDPTACAVKSKDDFLHVAFELSHIVAPSRFSFGGAPCLYLANSLAVAYNEIRATEMSNFNGVKFKSKIPLRILNFDFHTPTSTNPIEAALKEQYYGLLYPLYLTCFTRAADARHNNEYLIPQLVARWVNKKKTFVGIRYPSTRVDSHHNTGEFYNLTLYPVNIQNFGYCSWLKDEAFNVSDVCSYALHRNEIEDFFGTHYSSTHIINENIITIEWPYGNATPLTYNETDIGQMEFYLVTCPKFVC